MDAGPPTLELRLTILEGELRRAHERVRVLEAWRRRVAHGCVLMFGGMTALLLMFGLVVPTPAAGPARFAAPLEVVDIDGKVLMRLGKSSVGTGGFIDIFSSRGPGIVGLGASAAGHGVMYIANRAGTPMVALGTASGGGNGLVQAYGPTGKCNAASGLVGIAPCSIQGR